MNRSQGRHFSHRLTERSICSPAAWVKVAAFLVFFGIPIWASAVELDSLVDSDLHYERRPVTRVFHPRLMTLWSEALARSEIELKRQAARAFVQARHAGMEGVESAIPTLKELLAAEDLPYDAAYDVARALIELEAVDAAELLMRRSVNGKLPLALLVEPALARWDFQPMRSVWLQRLDQKDVDSTRLGLAIDGLQSVGETQAAESLRRLVLDTANFSEIRLKAALALGVLQQAGLEPLVQDLLASAEASVGGPLAAGSSAAATLINRLASARLLRNHSGSEAVELMLQMAVDSNGAVASIVLERLLEIDPSLVQPINGKVVHSSDANVRRLAGQALTGQATVAAVTLLSELLDDPIPNVRIQTADQMVTLDANVVLSGTVRSTAMDMLRSERPRGVEQATMVLGAIDHETAADRMVSLLYSEVPEVAVASAWGLRKLAVQATTEPIMERLRSEVERTVALDAELWRTWSQRPTPEVDFKALTVAYRQMEQLMQALALMQYAACQDLLEQFLPTPASRGIGDPPAVAATFLPRTRSTAIWGLGRLPAGDRTETVSSRLVEILNGVPPAAPAESYLTRAAAAVGLGSMGIESAIPVMRKQLGPLAAHDQVGAACGRVLHQMAGDPLPETMPQEVHQLGWFLEPIK